MFGVFIKAVMLIFMFQKKNQLILDKREIKFEIVPVHKKGKFYYGVFVGHGPKTSIKNGLKLCPYKVIKTENKDSSN